MLAKLVNLMLKRPAIFLTILSFIVAITSPVILSLFDLNTSGSDLGSKSDSAPITREYTYSKKNLSILESAIAKSNGQLDYTVPNKDVFIKLDIEKVKDMDLFSKTIFLSGKVIGTWVPDSIGKIPITSSSEYASSRIKDYASIDIMEDMVFPDMINDDYYVYEKLLFNTLKSKSGKDVFVSEYRFAGNFNIVPDFRSYPFDSQAFGIQLSHKILPSYMLRLEMLEPTIKLGKPENFMIGAYKIGMPFREPSYLSLPENQQLQTFLASKDTKSSFQGIYNQLLSIENNFQTTNNPQQLSAVKKWYFSLDDFGPHSRTKITLPLTRQVASTWLKSVFPASLILLVLVAGSYIPEKLVEVRLALPPTILLALVFMQQSSHAGLPEIPFPILLDYFYMLLFIAAVFLLIESIIVSVELKPEFSNIIILVQRLARYFGIFVSSLGMFLIWLVSNLV